MEEHQGCWLPFPQKRARSCGWQRWLCAEGQPELVLSSLLPSGAQTLDGTDWGKSLTCPGFVLPDKKVQNQVKKSRKEKKTIF